MDELVRLVQGHARDLSFLADASVQCVVTSPPYWGLRQYAGDQRQAWGGDQEHAHEWGETAIDRGSAQTQGATSQRVGRANITEQGVRGCERGARCSCGAWYGALGLEPTPEMYVEHLVAIFREVRRTLRPDGTLWLNLGDSYAGSGGGSEGNLNAGAEFRHLESVMRPYVGGGLKPKNLVGIPWRVAFALQADGWYLRSDIIWSKPNPLPESVQDRPTKSHEYLFLLSKTERYFYDADAIREPGVSKGSEGLDASDRDRDLRRDGPLDLGKESCASGTRTVVNLARAYAGIDWTRHGRNARSVWTIATQPYRGAHFAVFPEALAERCLLVGSSPRACGACGAPRGRVTERVVDFRGGSGRAGRTAEEMNGRGKYRGGVDGKNLKLGPAVSVTTLGWRSTCEHEDGSGRSVVLDPFVGSGTTGVVAVRHGRRFVGVDLSAEYLELARQRIDGAQLVAPWA